jgi:hypothetical protein
MPCGLVARNPLLEEHTASIFVAEVKMRIVEDIYAVRRTRPGGLANQSHGIRRGYGDIQPSGM